MANVNDENGGAKQNEGAMIGNTAVKDENARDTVNLGTSSEAITAGIISLPKVSQVEEEAGSVTPAAAAAAAAAEIAISAGALPTARSGFERKAGRRWTQHEDTVLRELVEKNGNRHWKRIAKEFAEKSGSDRSDVQCLHRWNKCLKPGLLKGPWMPQEDETIKAMIEEHGGHQNVRWSVIAKVLKGRLGKQVRERWINHLDPTINKGEWTLEEDESLYELQKRFGNRWKWIAELMPGRSENGVKNRWHSIKPQLASRKNSDGSSNNGRKDMSQATKTASAAAVAAAIASKSNKNKRSISKADSAAQKPAKKRKPTKKELALSAAQTSLGKSATLSDLLSIGQSLAESADKTLSGTSDNHLSSFDKSAVTDRATELLRMSDSFREMARVILNSQSAIEPGCPQFNELISREISLQVSKQLGQMPTQLKSPSENDGISAPLSTDPVLFTNYYKVFSEAMEKSNKETASSPSNDVSPTQILAAAADFCSIQATNAANGSAPM